MICNTMCSASDATEDEVDAETVREEAALAGAEQAIKRELVPTVRVKKVCLLLTKPVCC
jgi:hypothetical protein